MCIDIHILWFKIQTTKITFEIIKRLSAYTRIFLSAKRMVHDKHNFLVTRKSFVSSAEADLNLVYPITSDVDDS
jgi:hypothetical protein